MPEDRALVEGKTKELCWVHLAEVDSRYPLAAGGRHQHGRG